MPYNYTIFTDLAETNIAGINWAIPIIITGIIAIAITGKKMKDIGVILLPIYMSLGAIGMKSDYSMSLLLGLIFIVSMWSEISNGVSTLAKGLRKVEIPKIKLPKIKLFSEEPEEGVEKVEYIHNKKTGKIEKVKTVVTKK